jgi:L-ascorbate metabolism protein UlaG (beta-lactamase superfamily)
MTIELTWAGHSCVRVQKDDFTLVIDPGFVSAANAVDDADALLISHEHLDHYDVTKIAAAAAARPGLRIYTNPSVAALLEQSGAAAGAKVRIVGHGDDLTIGGIPVQIHGEWHALIHRDLERVRNVGFLIDRKFFHPGDALTDPHTPVDLLTCPLLGLYTKNGELVDWIRHLHPRRVAPVHDFGLTDLGKSGEDGFFAKDPSPLAPGTGSAYFRPQPGTPIPL